MPYWCAILQKLDKHFTVHSCLQAKFGDRSTKIMQNINTLPSAPSTMLLITSVGVTDVTQFMGAKNWIAKQNNFIH